MREKRQGKTCVVSKEAKSRRKRLFFGQNFLKIVDSVNLKNSLKGYVLILMMTLIPVLLLGAKYVLDNQTLLKRQTEGTEFLQNASPDKFEKRCAREAALAVAQKWNPSLHYKQQRESMLRIADEIYNNAPTIYTGAIISQAVPSIDITVETVTKGNSFEPLKVGRTAEFKTFSPTLKTIARTKTETSMSRWHYGQSQYKRFTAPIALRFYQMMNNSLARDYSMFTTEDIFSDYCYFCTTCGKYDPIWATWQHYVTWPKVVGMWSANAAGEEVYKREYTIRTDLNDDTVKIEIEDDKIKVTTDNDVAYAVPAQCDVDIILTVPTNSAASNEDNLDKNTKPAGTTYISRSATPTDDAKSTPIYQITQAYREFLKNFLYTRGVNVGIIPYSGNVSLNSNKSGWVQEPNSFVPTYFLNGTYQSMIRGSMMYGTKGEVNAELTTMGSYAGSGYTMAYGILCRGNTVSYNGNTINVGDILSTENPSKYKFRQMIYNQCYAGNANLLSMKCEKLNGGYWMNPYFIRELSSDVKFGYEILGAFYPYYDDRNVSNFIFIPVTWANNLLQSWSNTGGNPAINTSADSTNLGRLSTPSKATEGRKRALILVVNKPDWFEPGELTYLGFDNDFSEIPMIESDCIRGEVLRKS